MTKAIIFDFDGVIADTYAVTLVSYNELFRKRGIEFDEQALLDGFGKGVLAVLNHYSKIRNILLSEEEKAKLADEKTRIQVRKMDEASLLPGVKELLAELNHKYKVGTGTSNFSEVVKHYFKLKGIEQCFQVIVSTREVENAKPAPDIFLKVAEELRAKPEECVVFEDLTHGIEAAHNAGMRVIGVATGHQAKEQLSNADLVVDTLEEKERIMEFLKQKA